MKKETFWIGTWDFAGYLLRVVSLTERGAQKALFKEYKKQKGSNTEFKTWDEFSDYYSPWIQKAELDEVVWP